MNLEILIAMLAAGGGAQAQGFPDAPITLIAPFAAGGSSDALARAIARGMEDVPGQPVIVQNLPGAGGTIGLTELATSDPNGYTIALGGVGSLIHSAGVYRDMIQFDVTKDIAPVTLLAATPVVVVAGPGSDVETLDALIAEAKAAPGETAFGSSGMGKAMHLTAELFQRETGTRFRRSPDRDGSFGRADTAGLFRSHLGSSAQGQSRGSHPCRRRSRTCAATAGGPDTDRARHPREWRDLVWPRRACWSAGRHFGQARIRSDCRDRVGGVQIIGGPTGVLCDDDRA